MKVKIISWNVRGVNGSEKRKVIKNFLRSYRVDIVCLQETKVQEMSVELVRSLGVGRRLNWKALNAEGSAGGILLFWDNSRITLVDSIVGSYSVSCLFRMLETGFYGPLVGYMVPLRIVLENLFRKSLARSRVFGTARGVLGAI